MCKKKCNNDDGNNQMLMMMLFQLMQRVGDTENALARVTERLQMGGAYTPGMQNYLGGFANQLPVQPGQAVPQLPPPTNVGGTGVNVGGTQTAAGPGIGYGVNATWRMYPV